MRDIVVAITAASYSGNKGAAAMLQSSIRQLHEQYGERLNINLMSVYPGEDRHQIPYDFIKIIPAKPEQILFLAFPLACLYRLFKWCGMITGLLKKNKVLKAYAGTDLVIDEAGISFVDSRGFVMNTYAFVSIAIPLLMGVPVVKYSQAMGSFHNPYNRFLAKWILPKLKLICARGQKTYENLQSINITENVKLCADGAFTMSDDPSIHNKIHEKCQQDTFFEKDIIGLSISSVVNKKCRKLGINYVEIIVSFIHYLNEKGYSVLLIANAARMNSEKPRNNDLPIGDLIYSNVKNKKMVRWYHEEMEAEEIREYISRCRFLVASRFHAMIGALEKKVPVLLIGWSHKYQEVLDMFCLGQYATDYAGLTLEKLITAFEQLEAEETSIRKNLEEHYQKVIDSSLGNVRNICDVINQTLEVPYKCTGALDYKNPDLYIGPYLKLRKGYAVDESIRVNAASGGMVTAFLIFLLETKVIDGAWVTKTAFADGKITYKTFIARNTEELKDASSSVYLNVPMMKHINILEEFKGKAAVVMTPCMLAALDAVLKRRPDLNDKVVLKLGLYCSGTESSAATELILKKIKADTKLSQRFIYRSGWWKGQSRLIQKNGEEIKFSYKKYYCAYKNAYFFEKPSCMNCADHYARHADISFGDIWLREMKAESVKYTSCVIRSENASTLFAQACADNRITSHYMNATEMVRSQKRDLIRHYVCADITAKRKWNHRLAYYLAAKNNKFSKKHNTVLEKIPNTIIYYYMCFIRVLLSF